MNCEHCDLVAASRIEAADGSYVNLWMNARLSLCVQIPHGNAKIESKYKRLLMKWCEAVKSIGCLATGITNKESREEISWHGVLTTH